MLHNIQYIVFNHYVMYVDILFIIKYLNDDFFQLQHKH